MENRVNVILNAELIQKKIERMAFEIFEENADEKELILVGIQDKGNIVAQKILIILNQISDLNIKLIELTIDKVNPLKIQLSEILDFNSKIIILVDDVANSGRTLLFSMKPFLEYLPKKIQTAVLIDRQHKSFPIRPDFS
ncbi:MAG: phosphoribosyltransferase family protein, partial [Chitinophagaceae bacterium]